MNKTKEIYLTIRLVVDGNADSQDIVDTLDYNRAVEKGDFGSAVFKAKGGRITINKESLRKETKDTGTKYTQPSEEELNVPRKNVFNYSTILIKRQR